MGSKFTVQSTTTESVDQETGEVKIVEVQKLQTIKVDSEDKFFAIYYNMLKTFYQIKYIKDVLLLIKLTQLANYNTGEVELSAKKRDELCTELDLRKPHLSTALKRLTELELISGERGSYVINPAIFWKGDAKTRKQILINKGIEFTVKFKM